MKPFTIYLFNLIFSFAISVNLSTAQDISITLNKKFTDFKRTAPNERIQIITDRDLYAAEEKIWFKALVFDMLSPKISKRSETITLSLFNYKSLEILKKRFDLVNGSVDGFIDLPPGMSDGVFYLQGTTKYSGDYNYYYKKVVVRKHAVPRFLIETKFPDKDFLPGDEIPFTIEFKDYYNEPLRSVNYQVDLFDGDKKIFESTGRIKKTGKVILNIKVPGKLKTGLLTYKIFAESKRAESRLDGKFPVFTDKVFIDFYPESGKIINGLESSVNFFAYDAWGDPLAIDADLYEDNKKVSAVKSNSDGMGQFNFSPNIIHTYHIQLNHPLLADKKFMLPTVEAKGIALAVLEKTSSELKFKLSNGYENSRLIYLLGVSDGEIFWTSEHEIKEDLVVDLDLSRAGGRLMHFIVLNAAYRIEGEQIVVKNGMMTKSLSAEVNSKDASKFSPVEVSINSPLESDGRLLLTAVNSPWIVNELANQNIHSIDLPFDLGQQRIFQSSNFHSLDFDDQTLEVLSKYYVPFIFGWDKVLKTDGAFTHSNRNLLVTKNKGMGDQLLARGKAEKRGGNIYHSNSNASSYFMTSNPRYISKIYYVKREKIPPYKAMLENGTSLLDVIQTIKPYNLAGSNIVFMGSANSFIAQGGALIVIDGVSRGTDAAVLSNLSPYDVEKIFISTNPIDIQRYTGLNSVGLIEITLKKGEIVETKTPSVSSEDTKFEAPEYNKGKRGNDDDCRSTLFWSPDVEIDGEGKSKVTFYNAGLISDVKGTIYFIPTEGRPSVMDFNYTIK